MPEPSYSKPTNQSSRRLSLISNSGSATSEAPLPNGHNRVPSYSQRPGTSQTVRPDSSMSSRGHSIPPVVVKKTRAPAQPRAEAPKTSRIRKKSPLNEAGTAPSANTSTAVPQLASSDVVLPSTETTCFQTSDIDNLTSGMKKIKLNLTTKAQREAKEQAKQAAKPPTEPVAIKPAKPRPAGKPMTETRIVPPVAPAAATMSNGYAPDPQPQPSEILPPIPTTPQPSLPSHLPTHLQQAAEVPLPPSSPATAQSYPQLKQGSPISRPAPQPVPRPAPSSDVFIPYQPEGPQPESMIQQEPLKWLLPNTTTTPSPMKRGELPVFTSTDAIPFGFPRVNGEVEKEESKGKDVDIWEVPETPKK
jgi:histone deacetylase HOS3